MFLHFLQHAPPCSSIEEPPALSLSLSRTHRPTIPLCTSPHGTSAIQPGTMATRGAVPAAVAVAVICAAAAVVSAASSRPRVSVPPSPPPSGRRVGIIYEPWHAPAYWAMENATLQMSIEQLVRSNGTSKMSDVFPPPHNLFSPDNGMGFWWHATPAGGRYCIYRKRDDEAVGCVALTHVCKPVTRVRTVSFPARALTSVSLLWFIGATETMQPLCRRTHGVCGVRAH